MFLLSRKRIPASNSDDYGLRDNKVEDGWTAPMRRAFARGLHKPRCPAAGPTLSAGSAGDETGPGDAHCREEGRVRRTVLGSAVGCRCGAGIVTGNAVTKGGSRGKKLLSPVRRAERWR
jgi:hypothetical protein